MSVLATITFVACWWQFPWFIKAARQITLQLRASYLARRNDTFQRGVREICFFSPPNHQLTDRTWTLIWTLFSYILLIQTHSSKTAWKSCTTTGKELNSAKKVRLIKTCCGDCHLSLVFVFLVLVLVDWRRSSCHSSILANILAYFNTTATQHSTSCQIQS